MSFLFGASKVVDATKLDMNRVRIRLEGLSQYASVSALLLNAALRLPSPKKLGEDKNENMVTCVYAISLTGTVLSALYTIMVFSMLSLYSKSFLGMGLDNEYVDFVSSTNAIRKSAFVSFLSTIFCFNISYILSLFFQQEGRFRYWITTGAVVVVAMTIHQSMAIMDFAGHMYHHPTN
jgi:hypothetical protein